MSEQFTPGRVTRISGPVVDAVGLAGAQLYEVVEVSDLRLIGEVIRIRGDVVTIQVYENTAGIGPGAAVFRTGAPLSLTLGPGLIGSIYDGVQRPLPLLAKASGTFIRRGEKVPALDTDRLWQFEPNTDLSVGDSLAPGTRLGVVAETPSIEHPILVPPDCSGRLTRLSAAGEYSVRDVMATVETDAGKRELTMLQRWPARRPRPAVGRLAMNRPLVTGQRVVDTFFPIARGGVAAVAGGFGTGKTMTQHALAKWCDADVIIYVGCGERGNEMTNVLTDFPNLTDPRTGESLMQRTIMIANTSNMPVAARELSLYTGITLAEYYRDMGYDVALMADSTSRWAEALRELSARLEEMPAEEGFPAYLASRLAEFYERAGRFELLGGGSGSISVVGAVSPPGGDFSEPVTQHTRRFVRTFWALDRDLANARHYPAINWLTSYSEYTDECHLWWRKFDPAWDQLRQKALELLQQEDQLQQIVQLVGPDVLPDTQRLVLFVAGMLRDGMLAQNAFDEIDNYCDPAKQVALLRIMVRFYEKAREVIDSGAPLANVRALPVINKIIRAKSEIPNKDATAMARLEAEALSALSSVSHVPTNT